MKLSNGSGAVPRASSGVGGSFGLVDEGYYIAEVVRGEMKTYQSGFGKNFPGKVFTYVKITPFVRLLNPEQTIINRQDLTFGVIDEDGAFFRPDGDLTKPALFKDAGWFLSATGFVDDDGNVAVEMFDPRLLAGQLIRVKVAHEHFTDKDDNERSKNKIVGWFGLKDTEVEENDWTRLSNGAVFPNERTAAAFIMLVDRLEDEPEPEDNEAY